MSADAIRLHPRAHYVDMQRALGTAVELYGDAAIDAGMLNARVADRVIADPFSALLILPDGPGVVARLAFLELLGQAAGADGPWRDDLRRTVETAPVLELPQDDLLAEYAAALPAFLPVDRWLEQVVAIMTRLGFQTGTAYGDFRLANDIAGQLSPLLGYADHTRVAAAGYLPPGAADEEWGAGYTGGAALYVDLFATTPSRQRDALRIAKRVEGLPATLRAQVYGWLLDASFEYFIGVGPIPPELPPAIAQAAPALAALHQDLTARMMSEFAGVEQEMTEE